MANGRLPSLEELGINTNAQGAYNASLQAQPYNVPGMNPGGVGGPMDVAPFTAGGFGMGGGFGYTDITGGGYPGAPGWGGQGGAGGGIGGLLSKGGDWLKKNPDIVLAGISMLLNARQQGKANKRQEEMVKIARDRYKANEPTRKALYERLAKLGEDEDVAPAVRLRDAGNPYGR